MANFRTTADLVDGVLRRCGEITSTQGTSPYQSAALLYLNQIYQTIISGGNELNLDVAEPWIWARSREPIVLTINPSITTGTVAFTQNSVAGTFSTAPLLNGSNVSLENWMIRPNGFNDTYRIISHTSGSTAFTIDAPYPQTTNGALSFTAFQIDYDLVASSINITNNNNTLDFAEDSANNQLVATLTNGGYTPAGLATAVATALTAASVQGNTYTGSYDSIQKIFTFTSNGAKGSIFRILGAGTNYYRSGWASLGFDFTNQTGALTYTGLYPLSATVSLTQPARVYYGYQMASGTGRGQIGGLDVVAFDSQYPLSSIRVGTPEAFCVIQERRGTMTIRLNRYLDQTHTMRVEFDHIPVPKDLYNNSSSIPILPRKFIKVLEFGASYYLCLDKEDSKADSYLQISQAALTAMIRQNRRELQKTGLDFGSVLARPDMMPSKRRRGRNGLFGYDMGNY